MVVSFIKKQLEGLKSEEEITHLLRLSNPDLTDKRINSLMETAKQHANIPILDDKTVTTIRNAAKDGDHTAETMIRALPDASVEKRMQARNVLYAERNEELFPLINPTILNKTVSRENGKLQIKNVNSVMPNIRISGSRAEPQSVAMAIKHFEKIRTTRSHRAGGSIGSMNSLNPYLIFAKPVVHPPKWTQSFGDYQQHLQNTQFLASMAAPHHTSQSFKFYKSGGSLPSFVSGGPFKQARLEGQMFNMHLSKLGGNRSINTSVNPETIPQVKNSFLEELDKFIIQDKIKHRKFASGGLLPSFASGSWVNPSLQRSAQQSVLKLSQMRSVAKLQQLRKQAQYKQESHAALQQRIAESTQRLMAMRRSTQSRMSAPRPNYDNMFNPMVDLMARYPSGGMKRAFRVFCSIGSNFSMMNDDILMNQAFNTTFGQYSGREFSINAHPPAVINIPRSIAALVPNARFDVNSSYETDSFINSDMFNVDTGNRASHVNIVRDAGNIYTLGGNFTNSGISPDQRSTYISQHVLGMVNLLSQNIPTGEAAQFSIPVKDDVNVEKLLAHGFQVSPHRDDTLIKDFVGLKKPPAVITVPQVPTPAASTQQISVPRTVTPRVSSTSNMAQVPSSLDADTVRKMLDPYTVGDTKERGFRLVHFKPGDQVNPDILKYIRDISQPVMDTEISSLDEKGRTGSRFAIGNINTIYNHLSRSSQNIMQGSGLVTALYDDSLELMSALRYSKNRPQSTYVDFFGTRGTVRSKGVGSQVFLEAMKHAHETGVTNFSLTPLSYPETLRFYRKHGMDRNHQFDLATHVPRLLKEQEDFKYVSVDKQLQGIHGNSRSTDAISRNINDVVLRNLKTRFSHAQGGLLPSFESGGPQSIYNMNDASMLTSLLSPDQVDHSAKVMAHASHIWSMMNGSDKGHNILQNAASLHDIGKTIDPKAHGKLASKFGSLLGIDKISKFLINNHSGTRQPSLKEFKKSQRSEVRKMLGALRLADVSARTGTLPLSMKKGSLKLGNTRGLDINKHQLQRIKSSLKMINRMNGGSISSFMGGGWTGLLKYAHLTKTPESASRLISRNSVNSLQSMAENTGLHGLLSSMIKSGSPDSAFKGLFYRKGLDANEWMEKVHQMKLQDINTQNYGTYAGFAQGGSGGIPALVSAKEAYLPPKMAGLLGSRRLDTLRSMADDNTLMNDIPELHKLFGGVPSINGAGVFAGGSGNPTADDIFTHLEPGSYILDYQTLEAMRKLDPRSVKFGGAISGMPIRRATGGVIGFAAGGFGDRARAFASNFYNEFKYPYQAEQTRVGSSARLQTTGYGTFNNIGIFRPDPGVDAKNQAAIDKYQTELEDWAVSTFSHLKPEDARKRVSAKIQEQTKNVVKGSGTKAVNVEETFKTLKPEVMFDSKDLEKIGKSSEDLVESFKNMTDNAFRDPNNSKKFFKTLNLGLVETEKHVQNVALEFTTLGKFSSHMKDFSFRLASVSMAAMGVNFSTMAVFQSITSGISQITAPFSDLESLMQNTGYLKAFGDAANVPVEAIQSLTGNTDGLVDTWKKIGGMTAYLQLSFASLGEALFKNDDMMEAFADGMEEVFAALKDPQTIRSMADLLTSMSQSLPVLADVVKGVAAALKLVADQPMIMQIMMYSTIFSMLLQPLFSLGSALLTFIGIGAGFINWSRGAVLAIKSLDIAFLGLNTTLVASLAYLALVALAIEGVARVYELLTGSEVTFKPSNLIMGALGFAAGGDDYVEGAGTTTNDKIPYMLSRGERVIPASLNARHYAKYEALETAATGEDYVGGSPNLTDYRYYEGIKSVTSIDTMKADQDTADTLTAARDGNAIRVIVKNANEIGGRHEEQQNEIQAPFAGGTPQLERIINPAPGLKIFDILGKFKPDLKLDWKPDFKFDLGKLDFKFDLGKIIADLFKKGGEVKPYEKIDTKSEPKSTLDWYKSFIDQVKSARGSASDDDWKPNERYFNIEDLKPPKSSKTKGGIFDTFKKFIPDSLKGFAAPEFARGDITKGNVVKSIIADKGPLKTGTGMLGYANPLDIFSVLNILNAGRFGTGATVAETVNQTIGGAVTGLGVAGSLVGGGIVKAAGFSKIGTAIALPGQVLSKAALPLAAATPFLIGAEGAMANRRFLAGESIEDIKNTPFDELSSAEKLATVLTGGIGTSATANGLKVLVGMHGEEAARQSLIATQTGIDSIANWIPGLNILNRGLGAVGGPSIGEVGVGGAMALVGLPESISDFAHAVAGLPAWFASLSKSEDQGDQATGSIAQTYDEMNKRIDTSGMQYVGKNNDEVVEWMNQQIAAQQQTQPNNISFTINAQPDVADQVYGIVDNALRSNGFYDGQRV